MRESSNTASNKYFTEFIAEARASLKYHALPGSKNLVYLHIPKCGGSSVSRFFAENHPHVGFYKLPHLTTLRSAKYLYPFSKLAFTIRDPISRIISGFYDRLRAGQPYYMNAWTQAEAVVFSHITCPYKLLQYLISDDYTEKATADFAMRSIRHLSRGYTYYFRSRDYLLANISRISIVHPITEIDSFCSAYLASLSSSKPVITKVPKVHAMTCNQSSLSSPLSHDDLRKIKHVLEHEYSIYNVLLQL